jgi:hypothetical protein
MSRIPALELTLQSTQTAERRARYKVSAWKASTPSHDYVRGKIDALLWQQHRLHAHYKLAFSRSPNFAEDLSTGNLVTGRSESLIQ